MSEIAPIRTPMYPGGSNELNWPWAKFFDSLGGGSGYSGSYGIPGASGFSGQSGQSGSNGPQGISGYSGHKGLGNFLQDGFTPITDPPVLLYSDDDEALYVGISGNQNWIQVGAAGTSGASGYSGGNGASGYSGLGQSGYSGAGQSGYSGFSGLNGESASSGYSGSNGESGYSGSNGSSGYSGISGAEGIANFKVDGYEEPMTITPMLLWNVADEALFVGISGYSGNWIQISAATPRGFSGFSGQDGYSGFDGVSGYSGKSGYSGMSGLANFKVDGYTEPQVALPMLLWNLDDEALFVGISGYSGNWIQISAGARRGESGYSGIDGFVGTSGYSGRSGYSGSSGRSGYSGLGLSGFSGRSGYSGKSGYSGAINVVYGTGTPPAAAGYLDGTLYFRYAP